MVETDSMGAVSSALARATYRWSSPTVVRTYDGDKRGEQAYEAEARILLLRGGYAPEGHAVDGGHIHVGRLLLTGGFSVFAGQRGIRSKGRHAVTFKKLGGPPTDVVVDKAEGEQQSALAEVIGHSVEHDLFPLQLLSGVARPHAEAVAAYLREQGCLVHLSNLDETASVTSSPEFLDQLERLAALREKGVLTEDEFAEQKARVLSAASTTSADAHPVPPSPPPTSFDVVLTSYGNQGFFNNDKIQVIKALLEIEKSQGRRLGLQEAKNLVESAPVTIRYGVSREEAEFIKTELEAKGATVELR